MFIRQRPPREDGGANGNRVKRPRDVYYFQVHYQPKPGARKGHFLGIRPMLAEQMEEMIRHGQLLLAGGYPSSIGGVWLLKVRDRGEAERLVQENPAVGSNLVTYKLVELQDPTGSIVPPEPSPLAETLESQT